MSVHETTVRVGAMAPRPKRRSPRCAFTSSKPSQTRVLVPQLEFGFPGDVMKLSAPLVASGWTTSRSVVVVVEPAGAVVVLARVVLVVVAGAAVVVGRLVVVLL